MDLFRNRTPLRLDVCTRRVVCAIQGVIIITSFTRRRLLRKRALCKARAPPELSTCARRPAGRRGLLGLPSFLPFSNDGDKLRAKLGRPTEAYPELGKVFPFHIPDSLAQPTKPQFLLHSCICIFPINFKLCFHFETIVPPKKYVPLFHYHYPYRIPSAWPRGRPLMTT